MQFYKGDELELKYYEAAKTLMDTLSQERTDFYNGAYSCFILGDKIWESKRSPLANAIPQAIFREAFPEIFETFLQAGSFEGYLSVFRKIFGPNVVVAFTVPGPGKLIIDIEAQDVVENHLIAREIESNLWVNHEVVDYVGDNIVVQSIKGMESEYEVKAMLFELVPAGIFTNITLTVG